MRDDAAGTGWRRWWRDDHLALGFRETAGLVHERVVIGEERAELVAARSSGKTFGMKPDFSCTFTIRSRMSAGRSSSDGTG